MASEALREVRVCAVVPANEGEQQPVLLLETLDGALLLPIWVVMPEAAGIVLKLKGQIPPRPLTHDLFADALAKLEVKMLRATITEHRGDTFFAEITLAHGEVEINVDARPSDAVSLALRAAAPIFVAGHLIDQHGVARKEPSAS